IRKGEKIHAYTDKAAIDRARAVALIENAFARTLSPGWWDGAALKASYISEAYRAGAFLADMGEFIYLDKFAVLEDARGEGLSRTVWRRFTSDYPAFFWRSRTENGFNAFYTAEADGSVKRGPWTVFWKGETDFARIARIAERVEALPESFE
ncbi:MAG: acetylglutamate kinase, partial [Hyphococcus sp.]